MYYIYILSNITFIFLNKREDFFNLINVKK